MSNKRVKISIITVCYNAEMVIEETIKSVIFQDYKNLEYIIIDGDSQDKTMDIVCRYASDERISYISEPDEGIYDAMNKGIKYASGDYLQFLNAGDSLADSGVLTEVVDKIKEYPADILYGNIIYHYLDGNEKVRIYGQFCSSLFYYLLGDCINHQAIFAKRECFNENAFDISYQICADREWMLSLKKKGKSFKAMNILICRYTLDESSASIRGYDIYKREASRCIYEHFKGGYFIYFLVEQMRKSKISASILHLIYKFVFIRKQGQSVKNKKGNYGY